MTTNTPPRPPIIAKPEVVTLEEPSLPPASGSDPSPSDGFGSFDEKTKTYTYWTQNVIYVYV